MTIERDDIVWEALPGSQTTVLSHSSVFEMLYHGTRGPGKSDTLLMCFAMHVGQGHGADWKGIIFRQTYKQLQDIIAKSKKWFPKIFPGVRFLASNDQLKWVFEDGEELLFRQFNKDDDYWNYHGHEYPFIGWDELTNWPSLDGYKRMISCCRSPNPNVPRMIRATTNPYGPGHNAVKFYFELPGKDGIIRMREYEFEHPVTGEIVKQKLSRLAIKGTVWENTILLNAQPEYISFLRQSARNDAELKAWLEGDWNIVAGGMFDDVWVEKHNVVKKFMIPMSWRIDRSYDWGSSSPFSVGWWAESDGTDYMDADGNWRSSVRGDLYRIGEWYGWNGQPNEGLRMLSVDIAKGIRERELKMFPNRKVHAGPADTQIYQVTEGRSIATDMAKEIRLDNGKVYPGVHWTRSDKSSGTRKTGWEAMRKMMKYAHPTKSGIPREQPGLFVFDICDQFVRTVPVAARKDSDLDDIDDKTEDHICDEVRYRVRFVGQRPTSGTTTGMY